MTLGTMNETSDQEELIQLEPLIHQVGGHSSMFVLDDATVCKPLIRREHQFYRTLPHEMKKYAPEFRGCLKVIIKEGRNGISGAALPNEQTVLLRNNRASFKNGRRKLRPVNLNRLDYEDSSSSSSSNEEDDCSASASNNGVTPSPSPPPPDPPTPTPDSSSSEAASSASSCPSPLTAASRLAPPADVGEPQNPWLAESQKSHWRRLKMKSDSSNVVECIMLENLTFKFGRPCVLDLKMGTRQYGDDAPEAKRRSQTVKASATTTVTLGVRLAGMQAFNPEKGCYVCRNKYFGRQLKDDSFKATLRQFLTLGCSLRTTALAAAVVAKLTELRATVSHLDSFRFFTSSLLILYDSVGCLTGGPMLRETPPRVDVRMIDFAHATHSGMRDGVTYSGPDEGILTGLDSLILIFEAIAMETSAA